jgi:hypothetical protein
VNSNLVFTKSNFCDSDAKLQNLNAQKWICLTMGRLVISGPSARAGAQQHTLPLSAQFYVMAM